MNFQRLKDFHRQAGINQTAGGWVVRVGSGVGMVGVRVGAWVILSGSAEGAIELGCIAAAPQAESNRLRLMTKEKIMIAFVFLMLLLL